MLRLLSRIDDIAGATLEPMLTDHDGTTFARLQILGDEQNAERDDVLVDIQDNLIAFPFRGAIDQSSARIERQFRCG